MIRRTSASIVVIIICLLATAGYVTHVVWAGPLDPPTGPVTSTYKTLGEVEPRVAVNAVNTPGDANSLFRISAPGSYYLTGNIAGVSGKHGVEIAASGVTLNLNGFDLAGVAGSLNGVSVDVEGLTNIAVLNGSVRNWHGYGVELGGSINCRVSEVLACGNTFFGINSGGNSTVAHCSACNNAGGGIRALSGGTINQCSVFGNTNSGIDALQVCTISQCTAFSNTGVGINTSSGCTITDCAAYLNTNSGISTINGCTLSKCTSYQNTAHGISAVSGCTITDCTLRFNSNDGILCGSQCFIRNNTCTNNGLALGNGAGIHATSGNRIEGNLCAGADRGIDVDSSRNIIIHNICAGNTTNWAIVANNICGPIVDRSVPASAAINGDSAPDSTGTTHPDANFTY